LRALEKNPAAPWVTATPVSILTVGLPRSADPEFEQPVLEEARHLEDHFLASAQGLASPGSRLTMAIPTGIKSLY